MKYLLVEAIKEDKKRGILTEYETNTHFASNETNNQRSSCNSSNGMGSIGSFLFQNSVRNMCKKYSDTSSTTSSTESTSSSVSSTSNSALNHNKNSNKQQSHQSNSLLPNKQELISKSINSISSASSASNSSTMSSNMNQNVISKQNIFLNNGENVEITDGGSQSVTSSPTSSSSSSPPVLAQQQQQQFQTNISLNKNLKSGSIHELLSLKTPINSINNNNNNNMSNLQQQQMNYLNCNRTTNSDVLPINELISNEKDQNVWRLTDSRALNRHVQEEQQQILKNKQFETSYSINSGFSSSMSNPILPINNPISKSITSTRRLTSELNGFDINSSQM